MTQGGPKLSFGPPSKTRYNYSKLLAIYVTRNIMARISLKRGWLLAILAVLPISSSVVNIGAHGAAVVARGEGGSNGGGGGPEGQKCQILGCLRCGHGFKSCKVCDDSLGLTADGRGGCCFDSDKYREVRYCLLPSHPQYCARGWVLLFR